MKPAPIKDRSSGRALGFLLLLGALAIVAMAVLRSREGAVTAVATPAPREARTAEEPAAAARERPAPSTRGGALQLVKVWDDGTRVYRMGGMQMTVLPDGEVLYLPDEL